MRWLSGLVHRHREPPAQLGLADQEQAEPVLRVHLVVGEQPQVLEHVAAQVLGLVDDEHRPHVASRGTGGSPRRG